MTSLLWSVIALMSAMPGAAQTRIEVHPDEVIAHVSRTMTGACIEDVDHEQYGGIYTQMVFGESFQEPPLSPPIEGFTAHDGGWHVGQEGALAADAGPGPKLVRTREEWLNGSVGVEVWFDEATSGNAGMILRVREAGSGADVFIGYEVSLDQARGVVVVGRHEHNWQPLCELPVTVPVGKWVALTARLAGGRIEVEVDGQPLGGCDDPRPLPAGALGLRPWQRAARFRNLWMDTGQGRREVPFVQARDSVLPGQVSRMWRPVCRGEGRGSASLATQAPFVGRQSQTITMAAGPGAVGIENRGLNRWGMCFRAGRDYEGCLWARAESETPVTIALESADGSRTYAEAIVRVTGQEWGRLDFALTPDADEEAGRLALYLTQPGSVDLGYVALHPGEWGRFHGLPSRRDVAEGLVAEGLTVLRCGGCMVNTDEYRWEEMIGPRDRREPYAGFWYPWSSNGWGIIDFIQLCEKAGFLCVPAFNMGQTPQSMAAFMQYVNGSPETEWGARRAADGHPEPYGLRYVQLGNEEAVDEAYWQHFRPMAEAIWEADPDVTLIVGDFMYGEVIADPLNFTGAPRITTLAAHERILQLAAAHDREVWFDVHVGTERPEALGGLTPIPSFAEALRKLCPEARFRVCVLELNAGTHNLRRALANAHAINELQRIGDLVPVVCSANCLQPDGQNDNGWDQGLLFLNPSTVWPQPPYFVMQMLSTGWLPLCVRAEAAGQTETLDVTVRCSEDGKCLQLQVVNYGGADVRAQIDLGGFVPQQSVATADELTGSPDAVNTAAEPDRVVSRRREVKLPTGAGSFEYVFAANSFTILRLR